VIPRSVPKVAQRMSFTVLPEITHHLVKRFGIQIMERVRAFVNAAVRLGNLRRPARVRWRAVVEHRANGPYAPSARRGRRNNPDELMLCSSASFAGTRQLAMFPWYSVAMLALESNHVIVLRLMKLAHGGAEAHREANLMIAEKIAAAVEAGSTASRGGDMSRIVERYREHVLANAARLNAERQMPIAVRIRRRREVTVLAWTRRRIEQLGPYQSLTLMLMPLLLIEPLKLLALAIAGKGNWPTGTAMILDAYAVSLLCVERVFRVVKPKLMMMNWFAKVWTCFAGLRARVRLIRWSAP